MSERISSSAAASGSVASRWSTTRSAGPSSAAPCGARNCQGSPAPSSSNRTVSASHSRTVRHTAASKAATSTGPLISTYCPTL